MSRSSAYVHSYGFQDTISSPSLWGFGGVASGNGPYVKFDRRAPPGSEFLLDDDTNIQNDGYICELPKSPENMAVN